MSKGFKRVLAGDTGTISFTLAYLTIRGSTGRVEKSMPFHGGLPNLVDREVVQKIRKKGKLLKGATYLPLNEQLPVYMASVEAIVSRFNPDLVVLERFQARGGKGPVIEQISMMNMGWGILAQRAGAHFRLVTAGEWKNAVNRLRPGLLDEVYAEGGALGLQPHQIDSVCIGQYAALKDPFSCWLDPLKRQRLLKQILKGVETF